MNIARLLHCIVSAACSHATMQAHLCSCAALLERFMLSIVVIGDSAHVCCVWVCVCEHFCAVQHTVGGLSEAQVQLRFTTVNQVLGTDMKKHFEILSRFQVSICPTEVAVLCLQSSCVTPAVHTLFPCCDCLQLLCYPHSSSLHSLPSHPGPSAAVRALRRVSSIDFPT